MKAVFRFIARLWSGTIPPRGYSAPSGSAPWVEIHLFGVKRVPIVSLMSSRGGLTIWVAEEASAQNTAQATIAGENIAHIIGCRLYDQRRPEDR